VLRFYANWWFVLLVTRTCGKLGTRKRRTLTSVRRRYCPGGCPTYANERLPPEYFTSPIIFVQDWDEVVEVMVRLDSNHTALLERQIALRAWYIRYIHAKATEIETAFGESTVKVR
jgi:hypothetical protein